LILVSLQEEYHLAEKKTIRVVKEALESSKERKFKESVDLAVNLRDIDLSIPKNRVETGIISTRFRRVLINNIISPRSKSKKKIQTVEEKNYKKNQA